MTAQALIKPAKRKVPVPPGATVELPHVSAEDAELVRHRGLLDAVAGVEFAYPERRSAHPVEGPSRPLELRRSSASDARGRDGSSTVRFAGRGIVICGGGERYLPSAYVLVRVLRHLGCALPVEIWHLGEGEMPGVMRGLFAELGAVCVDGAVVRRTHPVRRLAGWELKCFAMLHSAFEEVLLLDADNCPVRDPAFLFDEPPYNQTGAVFWPDYTRLAESRAVWAASGIPYRDEPEFESGQIVVDKRRCWKALNVAMHLNEYSDWWYRLVHGDKETFHLAWRKIGQDYAMPERGVEPLDATMLQFDFRGERLFQHRNFAKWKLDSNKHIVGFRLEKECMQFVAELREKWVPGLPPGTRRFRAEKADAELKAVADLLCEGKWLYDRVGLAGRELVFLPDGTIGGGAAGCERVWTVRGIRDTGCEMRDAQAWELRVYGEHGLTLKATLEGDGVWRGAWVIFEKGNVAFGKVGKAGQNGTVQALGAGRGRLAVGTAGAMVKA